MSGNPINVNMAVRRKVPNGNPTDREAVVTFTAETDRGARPATLVLNLAGDLVDQLTVGESYVLTLTSATTGE